jgi:hypothetical protein
MTSLAAHESGTQRLPETRRPAGIPGDRIQGGPMPVIAVTRLRLRDPALLTELFTAGTAGLAVSPEGLSWTTPRVCAEAAIRRMSPCYAG